MYFSTIKSLTEHKRVCLVRSRRLTGPGRKRGQGAAASVFDMMITDEVVEDMEEEEETVIVDGLEVSDETENILDLEESETNPMVSAPSGGIDIIMDLREWLKYPWSSD